MKFTHHLRNTILGYFAGIPILYLTAGLNPFLISGILCVFFAGFYSLVDKLFLPKTL